MVFFQVFSLFQRLRFAKESKKLSDNMRNSGLVFGDVSFTDARNILRATFTTRASKINYKKLRKRRFRKYRYSLSQRLCLNLNSIIIRRNSKLNTEFTVNHAIPGQYANSRFITIFSIIRANALLFTPFTVNLIMQALSIKNRSKNIQNLNV